MVTEVVTTPWDCLGVKRGNVTEVLNTEPWTGVDLLNSLLFSFLFKPLNLAAATPVEYVVPISNLQARAKTNRETCKRW